MKTVSAFLFVALCVAPEICAEEDGTTDVSISKDSFSDIYPAVWFSPVDGQITPLIEKSEAPPKPAFKIWIEPRDPEIATLDADAASEGKQGFQLLGHGAEHFKSAMPLTEKKLTGRINAADLEKPNAVFIYVDGKHSYAMHVTSYSKEKQELSFQWKAIGAD